MQNYMQIQWYVDILILRFPTSQLIKPQLIMEKQSQNQLMFDIIMALCLRSIAFIKSTDSQNYAKICQSCTINLPQLWMQIAELWVQNDIAMAGCQNWVCRCTCVYMGTVLLPFSYIIEQSKAPNSVSQSSPTHVLLLSRVTHREYREVLSFPILTQ